LPIKENEILNLIDQITNHFNQNINNRFLRKAFMMMKISQSVWDTLESMEEKAVYRKVQGYQFEEIYEIILAAATFIYNAKHDIKPRLKNILEGSQFSGFSKSEPSSSSGKGDRILREMAISNFNSNLSIFTDKINELYLKTVNLDKETNKTKKCTYEKIPELKQVGQLLVDA